MNGILCSERHLQAEMYFHLKSLLPDHQIWIEPLFELEYENEKWKIKPDILISHQDEIKSIVELKYVPFGDAVFGPDIEKMFWLEKCKGKMMFRLKTDPATGDYTPDTYKLSEDILSVFAVIARGDHSWAVGNRNLWKQQQCRIDIPHNFLHLVGKTYIEREAEFKNADS